MRSDSPIASRRPTKKTGLDHLLAATGYSWSGFLRLIREAAFRHEILMFAGISVLFWAREVPLALWGVQAILFAILAACEALNTAIEVIVDRVSPELSDFARQGKDLGSFAVFCMLAANGGFAAFAVASSF